MEPLTAFEVAREHVLRVLTLFNSIFLPVIAVVTLGLVISIRRMMMKKGKG